MGRKKEREREDGERKKGDGGGKEKRGEGEYKQRAHLRYPGDGHGHSLARNAIAETSLVIGLQQAFQPHGRSVDVQNCNDEHGVFLYAANTKGFLGRYLSR